MLTTHLCWSRAKTFSLGLALLSLLTFGCGRAIDTVVDTRNQTLAALDDAMMGISQESQSWQSTLQNLANKLTDETQTTVKNEVQNLATRTIAATGVEYRCNVDFTANRVLQGLRRVRARFLGQTPDPILPHVCQVVPSGIDLNLPTNRREKVDIFGYDFDEGRTQLFLQNRSGSRREVTASLNRVTHYHYVINLGASGVLFDAQSDRLVVINSGQELSNIPIIQPIAPTCIEEDVTFNPGDVTFMPPHTRGDREFNGNGPNSTATVRIYQVGNQIRADIYMRAVETRSDWTTAEGSNTYVLFTAPSDRQILRIVSTTAATQSYLDNNHTEDFFEMGTGGLVRRFAFVGDTHGDDAGVATRVKVAFNSIRLRVRQTGNCR